MMDIDVSAGPVIENNFENLPTDWYTAHAIEGSLENTDNGIRLKLTWEVLEGPFEKRRVWQNEWAQHSNPQSQEIGQKMIRTLGAAAKIGRVTRPEDLLFKPMQVRVGLNKKQEGYEQRNEIKGARPIGAATATTATTAAAPAAARPWGAKAA